jgi:hypothetical protein
MNRNRKMLAVSTACAAAVLLCLAATALASVPAGTTVTGKLKPGTKLTFKGSINSVPITVKCTSFSGSGKVPSGKPYTVHLSAPPKISGCTDSLKGKDTITTTGSWTLSESKTSPYTMTLTIPKDGAKFKSSVLSSCTVTAAPSGPAGVKGKYDGKDTDTVSGAKIPVKGTGCTATAASTSSTVVFSPNPLGPPPF